MDRVCLKRLIAYAMQNGAKPVTPYSWEWDVSGNCETPVRRALAPRAHRQERKRSYRSSDSIEGTFSVSTLEGPTVVTVTPGDPGPYELLLTVRCRKCDKCRRRRATMWARKAITEVLAANRTWFGTLTLRPDVHHQFVAAARSKAARKGRVDFDALAYSEQFALVHEQIGIEVTKMFKRMRKAGARFRYMFVVEHHKSGVHHYHVLLHEIAEPIRKATLDRVWPFGFSKWKLADRGSAWYVCKYLAKSSACRVRASLSYGKTPSGLVCGETDVRMLDGGRVRTADERQRIGQTGLDGQLSNPIPAQIGATDG